MPFYVFTIIRINLSNSAYDLCIVYWIGYECKANLYLILFVLYVVYIYIHIYMNISHENLKNL